MPKELRRNEDGVLPVPEDHVHGDHAPLVATVRYGPYRKFIRAPGKTANVVVRCPRCGWIARANQFRSYSASDPEAFFTDKALSKVVGQALNNFADKAPSCDEALVMVVMRS